MLERLLIVGLGSIGKRHLRIVRNRTPDVRIAALRHRRPEEADSATPDLEQMVTSVDEALAFRPQAAVIASPSSVHLEVASALAAQGVHLLIEKPISHTSSGVQGLIDLCRARAIVLMTGYNLRFLPSLRHFRALLAEGRVGRVLSVRAEVGQFLPAWRPAVDYRRAVSANASTGGGVLLELSHEIDYLRWLFGDVSSVSAITRRQSDLEIDVEDTALLMLEFERAAAGVPVVASLSMDCVRHDYTRTCTVIGDGGTLRWNALAGSVEVFDQGATAWRVLLASEEAADDSYAAQWLHFLSCMEAGHAPLVSGSDGLAVIRIIEAARRSSLTSAMVRVERDAAHA